MAITKVTRTLLSTGIVDNSNATAITIDSSENTTFSGSILSNIAGNNSTGGNIRIGLVSDDAAKYNAITSTQYDSGTETEGFTLISAHSTDASTNNINIGGSFGEQNSATSIRLYTAANATTRTGSERMRIDSSGNCGIGTTSPSKELDVVGTIKATGANNANTMEIFGGTTTNQSFGLLVDAGTSAADYAARFRKSDNTVIMEVSGSGRVGIGTSSPARALEVHSSSSPVLESVASSTNNSSLRLRGSLSATHYWDVQHVHGDNDLTFGWSGGEKVRITDTGNVKIKTTSDYYANDLIVSCADDGGITLVGATTDLQYLMFADGTSGDARYRGYIEYGHSADHMAFATSGQERMRIDSSGSLFIGCTSTPSASTEGAAFINDGSQHELRLASSTTSADNQVLFYNPNGGVGTIQTSGTSTSYNTSSDYRLKENVDYEFNALDRVAQLKPARFNFIADADTTVDGFIAHEVQDIVPEAIHGEKDAVDDAGNPEYQGIDQSKLIPLLTKAIQELSDKVDNQQTLIEDLKTRIETLENV